MEEPCRGRQPPLNVQRAFAGSRLEQQILIRAYQLAVPLVAKCADAVPPPEPWRRAAGDSLQPQRISQGA
jgi:hypothetical protein